MGEIELALHVSAWPEDEFVLGLAGVAKAGFKAMEARASIVAQFEDRVGVFQEMLAQQGVTLAAIDTQLRNLDLDVLEEEVERCANVARFLRSNRSEVLVLLPPARKEGDLDPDDWKITVEALNQVGRRTLDLDVRTCILPAPGTVAESKKEIDKLLEDTEPEYVRLCLNPAYLTWAGMSLSHFGKKYGSRIDYVQLEDIKKPRKLKSGTPPPQPATFGKGAVNMNAVAKLIDELDYSGWVTLILPSPHDDPVSAATVTRNVAKRTFGLV